MASTKMDAAKDDTSLAAVPMYSVATGTGELGVSCGGGSEQCLSAYLATAHLSKVHDQLLSDTTRMINQILQDVASRRPDRRLRLLDVGGEVLLCWTTPELPEDLELVAGLREIRRVLGVIDEDNAECPC
jgi:hypothetical protein